MDAVKNETFTLEQIRVRGLEALAKQLGPVGAVRFLQLYHHGSGDYSRERHKLFTGTTARGIFERIRANKSNRRN